MQPSINVRLSFGLGHEDNVIQSKPKSWNDCIESFAGNDDVI